MYDLTIAIKNKYFEFENDWLKIIRIRCNCTQFCRIPLSRNSKRMCNNSTLDVRCARNFYKLSFMLDL